eukprot:532567_1
MTTIMSPNVHVPKDIWWTVFGCILAIIGCIFQAIGFIIQKVAHNKIETYNNSLQKKSTTSIARTSKHHIKTNSSSYVHKSSYSNIDNSAIKKKKYIKNKLWLLGFFLNGVIGSLLNIIALNYAPQSVVLPLSATTLVGNTILATKYLNEPFPIQDFIGVILVIIGSIGTIVVGPKQLHHSNNNNNNNFTVIDLELRWANPSFLIFFGAITFIIIMDLIIIQIFNCINKRKKEELFRKEIHIFDGKQIGEYTIIYYQSFYLISYPLLAAYCASINFLVLKSFIQIINSSIKNRQYFINNFTFWLTYIYIIGIFVINFLLEMYRQKGLRIFGAIYIIPIYQVFVITLGTTMGAIYFNEMENMTTFNSILFISSVFITCIGVIILALSNNINKILQQTYCKKYLLTNSNDSDSEIIFNNSINSFIIKRQTNQNNNPSQIISKSELEAIQI